MAVSFFIFGAGSRGLVVVLVCFMCQRVFGVDGFERVFCETVLSASLE